MIDTQNRLPLTANTQQANRSLAETVHCDQFEAAHTADFTADPEQDRFLADTSSADVECTMFSGKQKAYPGKPYRFQKTHEDNDYVITFASGETFEGEADYTLTGDDAVLEIYWDHRSEVWRRYGAAVAAGGAPDGVLLTANNLDDLDDAPTALDNLGGTTVGKAVFTAASATAARSSLGLVPETFGPFTLSLVGTDAAEIRFQAPCAGTITAVTSTQSKGTVATGAATSTLTVAGNAPTGNTITHAIGHAAGQKMTMTPSGANASFVADDAIRIAITGTNDGANTQAGFMIEWTRTT